MTQGKIPYSVTWKGKGSSGQPYRYKGVKLPQVHEVIYYTGTFRLKFNYKDLNGLPSYRIFNNVNRWEADRVFEDFDVQKVFTRRVHDGSGSKNKPKPLSPSWNLLEKVEALVQQERYDDLEDPDDHF